MTTSPRKPLPIAIDLHVYVDAWQISDGDIGDEEIRTVDGETYQRISPKVINAALLPFSQISVDAPTIRTFKTCSDREVFVVVENLSAIVMPKGVNSVGRIKTRGGSDYAVPTEVAREILDSWLANSQRGY